MRRIQVPIPRPDDFKLPARTQRPHVYREVNGLGLCYFCFGYVDDPRHMLSPRGAPIFEVGSLFRT